MFEKCRNICWQDTRPIIKRITLWLVLDLLVQRRIYIRQVDVKFSFLSGEILKELYIVNRMGFVTQRKYRMVVGINKLLYGSRQAARARNDVIWRLFFALGVSKSEYDESLYIRQKPYRGLTIIVAYVDDMFIIRKCEHVIRFSATRMEVHVDLYVVEFVTKFWGVFVANCEVGGTLKISNRPIDDSRLHDFGMADPKTVTILVLIGVTMELDEHSELFEGPYL